MNVSVFKLTFFTLCVVCTGLRPYCTVCSPVNELRFYLPVFKFGGLGLQFMQQRN